LTGFRVDLGTRYVTVCVLQEGVGGSFQQYFYNRYKIMVYTGLRSDCIKTMLPDTGIDDVKKQRNAEYAKHINDPVLSSLKMETIRLLFFNKYNYLKHAAHSPFFSSKCRLFYNATFFGLFIIHILHTECAKI
jgi:hypothetical protein